MPRVVDPDVGATRADLDPRTRQLSRHRLALIAGLVCLGATLVLDVPGVADVRRFRSGAMVLSHLSLTLIAFGLSPRFPSWVLRAAALSPRQRIFCLAGALAGPLFVMALVLVVAPSYGHELFTREWGIIEPLQFVLWLTAAWLAFERARRDRDGSAEHRAFRLAGWGCILLAIEEIDYFGVVTVVAKVAGVPDGRIFGHHIGGLHDIVNTLGKASLVLGLVTLGIGVALILGWVWSRGLHRVAIREILSPTALPLVGTVLFLAIAELADIDHPVLTGLLGQFALVRRLREEPMELLAVICVNASMLAKLLASMNSFARGNPP